MPNAAPSMLPAITSATVCLFNSSREKEIKNANTSINTAPGKLNLKRVKARKKEMEVCKEILSR